MTAYETDKEENFVRKLKELPQAELKKLVERQKAQMETEQKGKEIQVIREYIQDQPQYFNKETLKNYRSMTHEELVEVFFQGTSKEKPAQQT